MRKLLGLLAGGVVAALSNAATAGQASNLGYIDAYYTAYASGDLNINGYDSYDLDGNGFGIRGLIRAGETAGFYGEYLSSSYDDTDFDADLDIEQMRLGIAYLHEPSGIGYFVDYVKMDLDLNGNSDDVEGIGGHLRLTQEVLPSLQLFGEIGYLFLGHDLRDSRGTEDIRGFKYMLGASYDINPWFSLLTDYRVTDLDAKDSEVRLKFKNLQLGARFRF